jgi:hypothetical protein
LSKNPLQAVNEDAMASDKLADDARKLEQFAQAKWAKKIAG